MVCFYVFLLWGELYYRILNMVLIVLFRLASMSACYDFSLSGIFVMSVKMDRRFEFNSTIRDKLVNISYFVYLQQEGCLCGMGAYLVAAGGWNIGFAASESPSFKQIFNCGFIIFWSMICTASAVCSNIAIILLGIVTLILFLEVVLIFRALYFNKK